MNPTAPTAAIATAIIAGLVALAKKFLPRKSPPKPEYITRAEFHAGIESTRDRIGAGYLALAARIDQHHSSLLAAIDRQGANFERRLDALDSAVARLDERSRELVALRYGADLTARQIGGLLGLRTNTVEVALHRALAVLRVELAPQPQREDVRGLQPEAAR